MSASSSPCLKKNFVSLKASNKDLNSIKNNEITENNGLSICSDTQKTSLTGLHFSKRLRSKSFQDNRLCELQLNAEKMTSLNLDNVVTSSSPLIIDCGNVDDSFLEITNTGRVSKVTTATF
jgi:hypothetical protein